MLFLLCAMVYLKKFLATFWIRTPPSNRASLPLGQLQETAYLPPQRTRCEALSTLGLSLLAALQSPSEEYKIMSSPLSVVCVLPALAIP